MFVVVVEGIGVLMKIIVVLVAAVLVTAWVVIVIVADTAVAVVKFHIPK